MARRTRSTPIGTILLGAGVLGAGAVAAFRGTGRRTSPSTVRAAGRPHTPAGRALDVGARLLQSHTPMRQSSSYICAFHFYSGDMSRQVEAHHYCTHVNEDLHQCVLFDSSAADAKLIGVEYIISRRLFETLPDDERLLWHSHAHEMSSAIAVAPGLPRPAERALASKLIDTYGKVFHFWQVDRGDPLPLGLPQLMMSFTDDGQIDPELIRRRDERLGISTEQRRRDRASIPVPTPVHGADHWKSGTAVQTTLERRPMAPATNAPPLPDNAGGVPESIS